MKTITVSRILAGCLFAPIAIHAQSEPRPPRGERPSFEAMWKKYDADGDGFLSIDEFKSMPRISRLPEDQPLRIFNRLDKNQDGKISREELRQMRQAHPGERPARGMRRLMELDADGSGGVSLEEFRAAEMFAKLPPERVEALFRRLDADGDGQITPKDRPELPPMFHQGQRGERPNTHRRLFQQLDPEKSGSLDFDQFRKLRGISAMDEDEQEKWFLRLDANGDRKLSFEEFSQAPLAELMPPPRRGGDGRRRGRPEEPASPPAE
ncbi:MAG: EF-hand domain-containing protein [Luteolibacter sp.]